MKKIYAYWAENKNEKSSFPFPVENSWNDTNENKQKIINKLQALYNSGRIYGYKGDSKCRICNCINGSRESSITINKNLSFVIPEGYFHYLIEHNVIPHKFLLDYLDFHSNININNIDHIISVLNNNNIDISEMKLHKQIADYYNKKAFSIMRDIDKTARKNNKKGFTVYNYFKVGYLIGEKQ